MRTSPLSIFATAVLLGHTSCRQMALLCAAAEERGSVKDYARKLGVPAPSITRAIDALEAAGLAQRLPHNDGRMLTLTVTPAGATLVAQLTAAEAR